MLFRFWLRVLQTLSCAKSRPRVTTCAETLNANRRIYYTFTLQSLVSQPGRVTRTGHKQRLGKASRWFAAQKVHATLNQREIGVPLDL